MPISKYYSGSGRKVMRSMRKTYGAKKAKKIFYATHNARKSSPLRVLVGKR
jgi:hypothetical protein